ncbi:hypothetical protein SGADD02_02281 [Streptococcus gallolyticus]|uniref:PTS EIIA type-2 domain-containing protein n=1 Tax=Streptococcus gallolyticus TaxID=315405 RepID=A0A139MFA8_9STRE|nr:hypothetical protein SGADD02_02281 [Streptococcus gallolyticus]
MVPIGYEGTLHLEMISRIATSLLEEKFIKTVKKSSNVNELKSVITEVMKGEN